MSEVYWISRLDAIKIFIGSITIALLICLIAGVIIFLANYEEEYNYSITWKKLGSSVTKYSFVNFLLFWTINIFIPSSENVVMILGVGGTIDYIKSNDKMKELPDKCVNAVDMFIENYIKKNEEEIDRERRRNDARAN